MRIGIVSDIHCNVAGLQQALDLMGDVDELLCAGDSIFEYRFSNETVEILKQRKARIVLGNHEAVFYGPNGVRARTSPSMQRDLLDFLASQPQQITAEIGGKRLLMVHGTPLPPVERYVYPATRELLQLAEVDADYVILGHTHYQMAERVGRVLVINPGSTGDARDPRNGRRLSCAVLDTASDEVRFEDYTV